MTLPRRVLVPFLIFVTLLVAIGLCLAFGGPRTPPPMASINDPFKAVDFSGLPAVSTFQADDGQALAYRAYVPVAPALGSVVLIHGSSASGSSMHPMASALRAAGFLAYALDVRGHGASGTRGHIDYVGQLESDLAAFVRAVRPPHPATLAGFSAGGGFVLRFAGSSHQQLFDGYLLLSPFISQDAPNQRPGTGGWVSVGIPRVVVLTMLNAIGIRLFNGLAVTEFALNEQARAVLTPRYDFNLAMNFRPETDYMANLARVSRPVAALVGGRDEAFVPNKLGEIFQAAGRNWRVEVLPGIGHIPLTLDPGALAAVVRRVTELQRAGQGGS